jgi:hypothetical protein
VGDQHDRHGADDVMEGGEFVVMDKGVDSVCLAKKDEEETDRNTRPDAGITDAEIKTYGPGKPPEYDLDEIKGIQLGDQFDELLHIPSNEDLFSQSEII